MKLRDLKDAVEYTLFWLTLVVSQLFFITVVILLVWKAIREN